MRRPRRPCRAPTSARSSPSVPTDGRSRRAASCAARSPRRPRVPTASATTRSSSPPAGSGRSPTRPPRRRTRSPIAAAPPGASRRRAGRGGRVSVSARGDGAWSADDFGGFDDAFSPPRRTSRRTPSPPLPGRPPCRPRVRVPATTLAPGRAPPSPRASRGARQRNGGDPHRRPGRGLRAHRLERRARRGRPVGGGVSSARSCAGIAIRGEDRTEGPEGQAGRVEGTVVIVAAAGVAVAAIARLGRVPAHSLPAAAVVAGCAILSWLAAGRLRAGASELASRGVREDADLASSNGNRTILVALALGLVALTGFGPLDALAALVALVGVVGSGVELIPLVPPGPGGDLPLRARHDRPGPRRRAGRGRRLPRDEVRARRRGCAGSTSWVTVRRDTPEARLRQIWAATEPALARRLPRERVVVHVERPLDDPPETEGSGRRQAPLKPVGRRERGRIAPGRATSSPPRRRAGWVAHQVEPDEQQDGRPRRAWSAGRLAVRAQVVGQELERELEGATAVEDRAGQGLARRRCACSAGSGRRR